MTEKPYSLFRRKLLRAFGLAAPAGAIPFAIGTAAANQASPGQANYPEVIPGASLSFPRDHGAHPDFRTEWWYLTAWLKTQDGPLGLQLTFFRSRTPFGRNNPSRFAARQLMFAHTAIADPRRGRLQHAEQAWRQDELMATSATGDTTLSIGPPHKRWTLTRNDADVYTGVVQAHDFAFNFEARPPTAPLLQGKAGFSQKGPNPKQASYYYSRPQLLMRGELTRKDQAALSFSGTGWLDHEWSSELLDPKAQGWDWVGLNFNDGSALMAFEMRARQGGVLQRTARLINASGQTQDIPVTFTPIRHWESPRTGTRYPVTFRLRGGPLDLRLDPLMNDQELDSRRSTGTIYWEGAVRVSRWLDEPAGNEIIGRGYLEMTGYGAPMKL